MISVVGVIGCSGRMGRSIASILKSHPSATIGGGIAPTHAISSRESKHAFPISDNPDQIFPNCDLLIDFSHTSATATYARLAENYKKPLMIGTTGLSDETIEILKDVSTKIPLLLAANTSLSLVVTKKIAQLAAFMLQTMIMIFLFWTNIINGKKMPHQAQPLP